MTLLLGDTVPDFEQESTQGSLRFHEWIGSSWAVLFSHPKDFTPVCTTELGEVARLMPEFSKRNTKVVAVSVDPLESHQRWIKDIESTQKATITYPMLADADRKVSKLYDMIHPSATDSVTVRTVFIIDPDKKLRTTLAFPPSTGRNFKEILRVIDSLQLTDSHKVATPVNWEKGDDCIILPSIVDPEQMAKLFPKGWTEVRPYLRITPQPDV